MIVQDMNKHNSLARTSGLCLIYCECFSKTLNERMTIVAALTDGDFYNINPYRKSATEREIKSFGSILKKEESLDPDNNNLNYFAVWDRLPVMVLWISV